MLLVACVDMIRDTIEIRDEMMNKTFKMLVNV